MPAGDGAERRRWPGLGCGHGGGQRGPDVGPSLKVKPTGFAEDMPVKRKSQEEVKVDSGVFWPQQMEE